MSERSSIEWTESTWNPLTGCVKVSAGCHNCYAERLARRLQAMGNKSYAKGFLPSVHEHLFDLPLRWKTPRKIFVNSMSDLFLEDFSDDIIRRLFDVMNRAHWHIFQILTKRSKRLFQLNSELVWTPNIWMGVTVENNQLGFRIDHLRGTGAHTKFLSLEPLLEPLPDLELGGIDWVIVGGESGPGARTMAADWVKGVRDRCLREGVPFFFKQWGGTNKKRAGRRLEGIIWEQMPFVEGYQEATTLF